MPLAELMLPLIGLLAVLAVAELYVLNRLRSQRAEEDAGGDTDPDTVGTTDGGSATDARTPDAEAEADAETEAGSQAGRPDPDAKAAPDRDAKAKDRDGPPPLDLTYVARVVTGTDGERIGESLCLAGDRVIVKDEEGFLAVPVAQVAESGEDLVVRDVDWDRARRLGGDWAKEHHDPIELDDEGMPRR